MRRSSRSYRGSYNPGATSTMHYVDVKHAENVKFGLKDYAKTARKYSGYKNQKYNEIKPGIRNYLNDDLADTYYYELKQDEASGRYMPDIKTKSGQNRLRTQLNSLAYRRNMQEISELGDFNPNEKKNFTIKMYLDNYDQINRAMKIAYNRYITEKM